MQTGLPRPSKVKADMIVGDSDETREQKLVREQMLVLISHDLVNNPFKGSKQSDLPKDIAAKKIQQSSAQLGSARQLIEEEYER